MEWRFSLLTLRAREALSVRGKPLSSTFTSVRVTLTGGAPLVLKEPEWLIEKLKRKEKIESPKDCWIERPLGIILLLNEIPNFFWSFSGGRMVEPAVLIFSLP